MSIQLQGKTVLSRTILCIAALTAGAGPALADAVAEFYKGKQMRFIIRTPPGGDYDSYSILFARHIWRHIPGQPSITPVNMIGGGGIIATNYIANLGPQDGTILSIISQGLPVDQALGMNQSLKADLRAFQWIGNIVDSNQLLAVWHTSPAKTLEEAKQRVTAIGSTGAGSISVQLPAFYNNVLGTKFRIIVGYAGGQAVDLAMERGEVEGRGTNTLTGYKTSKPHYLREGLIRPLIQVGLRKEPELPDVPLLLEQNVPAADKPLLEFMSLAVAVGRPIATSPGTPPARVAALRAAFQATLKDPEFLAEAKKMNAEIRPQTGDELASIVRRIIDAPPDVKERVRTALQPRSGDSERITKPDKK